MSRPKILKSAYDFTIGVNTIAQSRTKTMIPWQWDFVAENGVLIYSDPKDYREDASVQIIGILQPVIGEDFIVVDIDGERINLGELAYFADNEVGTVVPIRHSPNPPTPNPER